MKKIRKQIIEKFAALITGAFALVAALAWNSAIQAAFKEFIAEGNTISAQFLYASVVTVVAVLATLWIGRLAGKEQ